MLDCTVKKFRAAWLGWTIGEPIFASEVTGLDRRCIFDFVDRPRFEARRYPECLTVAMIDVNRFKLINDELGYDVGDFVLGKLGELVTALLRRTADRVYAWGGDELVFILGTDLAGAMEQISRLEVEFYRRVWLSDSFLGDVAGLGGGRLKYNSVFNHVSLACGFAAWERGQPFSGAKALAEACMKLDKKRQKS